MLSCKVLVGPISTDREYQAGESIVLSDKDASQLAGYGLLEILGEVEPKFPPHASAVEDAPIVEAAPAIEIPDEVIALVDETAVVTEVAPIVEEAATGLTSSNRKK